MNAKPYTGNTLNFKSHIRENQWQGLLKKSYIPRVNAGIIAWFIDLDKTFWIDIQCLEKLKINGKKSFNATYDYEYYYKIGELIEICGIKKRVFFEYDLEKFLEDISYELYAKKK